METSRGELTQLLRQAAAGDREAQNRLFLLVFPKLRKVAANKMRLEHQGHSLSPTALIAEAFLRLAKQEHLPAESSAQFLAVFAITMRRVLIDHAKKKQSEKNGGDLQRVQFPAGLSLRQKNVEELLDLHRCLERLEDQYPRHAKIVELRFFGGLSNPEIAELLDISLSTVEADWRFARAWLLVELQSADYATGLHAKRISTEAV